MTSIPSGPLVVPVAVPPVAVEEDLSALLARFGVTDVEQALAALEPVVVPEQPGEPMLLPTAPAVPEQPDAVEVTVDAVADVVVPVVVVPVQAPPPFVPAGPPALAPELLAAAEALSEPSPRVHFGFRDGSTADLEPGSQQAQALADLARAMTTAD